MSRISLLLHESRTSVNNVNNKDILRVYCDITGFYHNSTCVA